MKRSLGRRSSALHPPRTMNFSEFASATKERRSGIPVRSNSAERTVITSTPMLPRGVRSQSSDRISTNSIVGDRCSNFGGERPPRSNTLSTNSSRMSSFGGSRGKKDNRPILEKDWQMSAQSKIEDFLRNDPEGCELGYSIRPINLKLFISIVDLLLRRLEGGDEVALHKENYITELPYRMKKLFYRGKVERSWLISVNTSQSWCHALACMDFLLSCVLSQMVNDPLSVLYPESFFRDEEDPWDYKVLLPYFQKSYELYTSNDPNYNEYQEAFDRELIEMHNNDVFERISQLEEEIKTLMQEYAVKDSQRQALYADLEELKSKLNIFNEDKERKSEEKESMVREIEDLMAKMKQMTRLYENQLECLEEKQKANQELEEYIKNQNFSRKDVDMMRQKRASLQREMESERAYLNNYEEIVFKIGTEVLGLKNQLAEEIRNYNMELQKLPLTKGLEGATLPSGGLSQMRPEVEKAVEMCSRVVEETRTMLEEASVTRPHPPQAFEELILSEKMLEEKEKNVKAHVEKYAKQSTRHKEKIRNMKEELKDISSKMASLGEELVEKSVFEEQSIIVPEMERELEILKYNAVFYINKCKEIKDHYEEKAKNLLGKYKKNQ